MFSNIPAPSLGSNNQTAFSDLSESIAFRVPPPAGLLSKQPILLDYSGEVVSTLKWCSDWLSTDVSLLLVIDPTVPPAGFYLAHHLWSTLNHFRTDQGSKPYLLASIMHLWSFRTDCEAHRWRLSIDKISRQPTAFASGKWWSCCLTWHTRTCARRRSLCYT